MREYLNFITGPEEISIDTCPDFKRYLIQSKKPSEKTLYFDSNYECGNLEAAFKTNINNYNLLMKVDTNTRGNSYWFNFKVRNFRIG